MDQVSSKEALTLLSKELAERNARLDRLSNDLSNIQNATQQAIVLLGRNLEIRRFSVQAEKQFNLLPSDLGRSFDQVEHGLDVPGLEALIHGVIALAREQELETRDRDGRWFSLRLQPCLTQENTVDGVVLMLMDIDANKRAEKALIESEVRLRAMFDATSVGVSESDPETGKLSWVNDRLAKLTGYSAGELIGKAQLELTHPDDRVSEEAAYARLLKGEIDSWESEKRLLRKDGSSAWVQVTVNLVRAEPDRPLRTMAITVQINERQQTRQTLANLAAEIVNWSDDAIISKDLDGIILSWNPAAERMFGYTAAEAIGAPVLMLIPSDLADEEPGILRRIRSGEMIDHYQTVRQRKDGSLIDVSLTISPIRDTAGLLIGASKIVRDITEQKRAADALQASEFRYRRLYDSIDEGFSVIEVLFDSEGNAHDFRYLEVNPAFEKQTGLRDVVGKRIRELVPQIESLWMERYGEVALTRESIRFVAQSEVLGRWFDVNAFPIDSADRHRVACLFYDVSERKLNELALRDADRRKNEFLALLAHELRNPLAPLRNSLEILHRIRLGPAPIVKANVAAEPAVQDLSPDESDKVGTLLSVMDRQLGQMVRLVDDLLDVSRISRGKIELRLGMVDLSTLVQQTADAARPACDRRDQRLTVELPSERVRLIGDPARLTQLIGNLIHNASKFTDRGGRIEVILETESLPAKHGAQEPHHVLIRVRDNGIGIAADQIDRIFQMFTQVDTSMMRSSDGLGIGLALVKSLADLHGGTVVVHSAGLGHGSEFVVRLPSRIDVSMPEPTIPGAATGQRSNASPMRILVVDDNHDAAESLAALLQLDGHQTHLEHDGPGAVDAAATLRPDVILLDIGLPGLSGYDAARRIRAQQREGDKPPLIVALTGWGQEQDRRRSEQAGIDAHLVKPVDYDALMKLMR